MLSHTLTLEERERIAYINGNTHEAALLAQALDAQDALYEIAKADGYDDGYTDGFDDGYKDGEDEGYGNGHEDGIEKERERRYSLGYRC